MTATIPVTSPYPAPSAERKAPGVVVEQPVSAPAPVKGQRVTRHGTASENPKSQNPNPNGTAGRVGQIVTAANRWRENYNAIRGLGGKPMRRVVELIESGQRGDTAYLQWTFRAIERRHPLSALIARCEAPLMNFDWEIKIKDLPKQPGGESPESKVQSPKSGTGTQDPGPRTQDSPQDSLQAMAERQQATLKAAYDRVDNLKKAFKHLHLAQFRGYAHLQKWRDEAGEVFHLETLNQWCVCRDGLEGNWFWNPDSKSTSAPLQFLGKAFCIGGEELPLEDFIIEACEMPIDELALINFVRSQLCEKDWDGFIEIVGIPGGVVIMPGNVPQGKESEYESAAEKIASGGSGALPAGSDYKPNDASRANDPFTPRLKHLDEQIILAGTGGKLTMLAESGSGTLAGGAHSDTFEEIADARAQLISERLQRDFDAEVLARKHPGEPVLVYFKLGAADADSPETITFKREIVKGLASHEILARVVANQTDLKETIRDTGMSVNEEFVDPYVPVVDAQGAGPTGELVKDSEGDIIGAKNSGAEATAGPKAEIRNPKAEGNPKSEIRNPNDQKPIANRQAPDAPSAALEDAGIEHYARAVAEDLQAVRERVAALLQIDDDNILRQRASDLASEIEKLKADILHLPKSAQALAEVQVAALFTGLTQSRKGAKAQ